MIHRGQCTAAPALPLVRQNCAFPTHTNLEDRKHKEWTAHVQLVFSVAFHPTWWMTLTFKVGLPLELNHSLEISSQRLGAVSLVDLNHITVVKKLTVTPTEHVLSTGEHLRVSVFNSVTEYYVKMNELLDETFIYQKIGNWIPSCIACNTVSRKTWGELSDPGHSKHTS